jgi:uncharacterized protein (DUF1810 family)
MTADPWNLQRFVEAQHRHQATALAELRAGHKRSHWMWFIFPQLRGLGFSENADYYGIGSLEEARAYLAHPVLSANLRAVTAAMLGHANRTATAILGSPDDLKFHASMTLFAAAADDPAPFEAALQRFFGGSPHQQTLTLLARQTR